jgi:hypothetical protein
MVSFLAGLSSFAPNFMDSFQKGEDSAYKRKKEKREDAIYSDEELGKSALMKALMPQQPQMGPGQPSQPMQQPAPQQPQAMPMSAGGGNAGGMQSVIAQAAQKYGIPPEVGIAMGKQESGLNPNAPHGGLMQILDSTARQPGYGMQGVDPAALRDPRANAEFGMHYLAARNPNVNWSDPAQRAKALQSYNGGGDPNYVSHVTGRMGGGGDPQGQQPQSAQGGGGDWRQFAAKIMTSNPNLTPGALLYALHAAQPFMNADSRAQIQQLGLEMREKNIESRERIAGAATTERGREADLRSETQTHIAQAKLEAAKEALQDKHAMFDAREARLQKHYDDLTEQRKVATGEKAREFDIKLDMLKDQRQMLHEEKQEAISASMERLKTLEQGRAERLETSETGKEQRLATSEGGRFARQEAAEMGKGSRLETAERGKAERLNTSEQSRDVRQERGISAASDRQERGIGAASDRQATGLAAAFERQGRGLAAASTRQERGIGAASDRQATGLAAASTRQERGIGAASDRQDKSLAARAEQFIAQQDGINDRFAKRFAQAEEKIANAKTKEAKAAVLTELRQAEQDRRAAMANRVKAAAAGMDTKELKALEEEERQNKQDAEQRIDALTKQARGDAPARAALGGREAATQAAPKGKPLDDTVKRQMQEAIQAGASKEAIAAKARELGYDISGF